MTDEDILRNDKLVLITLFILTVYWYIGISTTGTFIGKIPVVPLHMVCNNRYIGEKVEV